MFEIWGAVTLLYGSHWAQSAKSLLWDWKTWILWCEPNLPQGNKETLANLSLQVPKQIYPSNVLCQIFWNFPSLFKPKPLYKNSGGKWSVLHRGFVTGKEENPNPNPNCDFLVATMGQAHQQPGGTVSPRVSWHRVSTMTGLPTQRRNKMDRVAGAVKGQKTDIQFCTVTPNTEEKISIISINVKTLC